MALLSDADNSANDENLGSPHINFFTHPARLSFPNVINKNIPTLPFLDAVNDLLKIYGK